MDSSGFASDLFFDLSILVIKVNNFETIGITDGIPGHFEEVLMNCIQISLFRFDESQHRINAFDFTFADVLQSQFCEQISESKTYRKLIK